MRHPLRRPDIICTTENDPEFHLAKFHFKDRPITSQLSEIPWSKIFQRKLKYLTLPQTCWYKSLSSFIKRKLIKILCNNLRQDLYKENIEYILCSPFSARNIIVAPCHHVYEIYRVHCPQMFAVEISNRYDEDIINDISKKSKILGYKDFSTGITVFANPISESILIQYRINHPNKTIVVRFHDLVEESLIGKREGKRRVYQTITKLMNNKVINKVESYCRYDASAMKALYRPNGVNPEFMKSIDCPLRYYLVQFIGAGLSRDYGTNKRLEPLAQIHAELNKIFKNPKKWVYTKVTYSSRDWLPYSEFASISAKAEIYIDLIRVNENEGFSFRIPEALTINRKIITNRKNIKDELFYDPERIFIIGFDPISRLKTFLEADLPPLPISLLNKFDSSKWWIDSPLDN